MGVDRVRYHWLNFHVPYACRNSGACCSSGWPIPIERERAAAVLQFKPNSELWLVPLSGAPEDVAGTLAIGDNDHCVFHVGQSCAIHSAKPSACRHFPYVCLIDQRGVHVTLSHYCPTAASLLFEHDGPIEIVEGPPPIAGLEIPEGLDARESLPPLASATRLMSFQEFSDWETAQIAMLSKRVARDWPVFGNVVARYLAAKLFASWAAYQGDGTDAVLKLVDVAESRLKAEVARQCAAAGRALDADLLKEAIRQSDLFLVHRADSRLLSAPE
ncbi:MAG: YkgJ family cysteine cluster protein [Vicinamibacterales bacterium]